MPNEIVQRARGNPRRTFFNYGIGSSISQSEEVFGIGVLKLHIIWIDRLLGGCDQIIERRSKKEIFRIIISFNSITIIISWSIIFIINIDSTIYFATTIYFGFSALIFFSLKLSLYHDKLDKCHLYRPHQSCRFTISNSHCVKCQPWYLPVKGIKKIFDKRER